MTDFTIKALKTTPPTPNELRDLINQFNGLLKQFKALHAEHETLKSRVQELENLAAANRVDGPIDLIEEPISVDPIEISSVSYNVANIDSILEEIQKEINGDAPLVMAAPATLISHEITVDAPVVDLGGFKEAEAEVTTAPERNVYYVDVGDLPPEKAAEVVETMKEEIKVASEAALDSEDLSAKKEEVKEDKNNGRGRRKK